MWDGGRLHCMAPRPFSSSFNEAVYVVLVDLSYVSINFLPIVLVDIGLREHFQQGQEHIFDLEWKLVSVSHRQELGQLANFALLISCTRVNNQSGASLLVDTTLGNDHNSDFHPCMVDDQSRSILRMPTSSPAVLTLGWYSRVVKTTLGATRGYLAGS